MKIAYFNCSSGIAGDMIIASLIDAGVDYKLLEKSIKYSLGISNWKFDVKNEEVFHHFPARRLEIVGGKQRIKSPAEMVRMVKNGKLSEFVKMYAVKIFETLIKAESKVHKIPEAKVHFHELSCVDTLIDVVGSCIALEMLKVGKVYCSEINIGNSAPAASEIIKNSSIPVYSNNHAFELATPTGVSIISNISSGFGRMPVMRIEKTGISAGSQKVKNNVLKVFIGERVGSYPDEKVVVLETNIDDMDPRIYPYVAEKLLGLGALDVWLEQILMKKGRPGTKVCVLTSNEREMEMADILFEETTSLGIRRNEVSRYFINREKKGNQKFAYLKNRKYKVKSEFEDIKKIAIEKNIPLRQILD